MHRVTAIWMFAFSALAAAQPQPPPRPVEELRFVLSRFNNGSEGFAPSELTRKVIGFSQAARNGEFALAYFEDHGDNRIHPPLHLAVAASGKPWLRKSVSSPADKIGAVGSLFVGKDYLLVSTRNIAAPSTQHLLVFSRDLNFRRSIAGGLELEPLPNGTVVFHPNRDVTSPAVRSESWLFDVYTGESRPLYPIGKQSQPSAEYQKQLPELIRRLNELVPNGNYGRGYRVEWYASTKSSRAEYDPKNDRLTFEQVISPASSMPPVPGFQSAAEVIPVSCGPMLKPNPRCTEGARTISVWPRQR